MRGLELYVSMMGTIRHTPTTIRDLMASHGVTASCAYPFFAMLHRKGWLHIAGWQQKPAKRPLAVYGWGRREDAPFPAKTPKGKASRVSLVAGMRAPRANLTALCQVLADLEHGHCTARDLADTSGLDVQGMRSVLGWLHKARLCRVVAWNRPYKGPPVPVYALGSGKNAPRPERLPKAIIQAQYMTKRRERELCASLQSAMMPMREAA